MSGYPEDGPDGGEHPEQRVGETVAGAPVAVEPTGHAEVDAVLRSLEDVATRPLEEQVRVFESAHERLRSALTEAADGATGPSSVG